MFIDAGFANLLQFTCVWLDAVNVAIYALWEPKKNLNLGLRAKKTEFAALH